MIFAWYYLATYFPPFLIVYLHLAMAIYSTYLTFISHVPYTSRMWGNHPILLCVNFSIYHTCWTLFSESLGLPLLFFFVTFIFDELCKCWIRCWWNVICLFLILCRRVFMLLFSLKLWLIGSLHNILLQNHISVAFNLLFTCEVILQHSYMPVDKN